MARCRFPQPAIRKGRQRLLVSLGIQSFGLLAALMVTIAPVQAQPYTVSLTPQQSFAVSASPTEAVTFTYDLLGDPANTGFRLNVVVRRDAVDVDGTCQEGVLSKTTCKVGSLTLSVNADGALETLDGSPVPSGVDATPILGFPGYVSLGDPEIASGFVALLGQTTGTLIVTIERDVARELFTDRTDAYIFVEIASSASLQFEFDPAITEPDRIRFGPSSSSDSGGSGLLWLFLAAPAVLARLRRRWAA